MAMVAINETHLHNIAGAIRYKNGTDTKYLPADMAVAITTLAGDSIPAEAFDAKSAGGPYKYYGGSWDWFLNGFGNRIEKANVGSHMFAGSQVTKIPFAVEFNTGGQDGNSSEYVFANCYYLTELPTFIYPTRASSNVYLGHIFENCYRIREIPDNFFERLGIKTTYGDQLSAMDYVGTRHNMFANCYSLRKLPNLTCAENKELYSVLYSYMAQNCYALDEIVDIPVLKVNLDSNVFYNSFMGCGRVKDITFATNADGTIKTANWKNQTIDLSSYVGWESHYENILGYNSGITGKRITTATEAQSPDYAADGWTTDVALSRYNYSSAVRTINSLPDTSAYITANGGTNTIKFRNNAGSAIGSKIGNLGESTIAIAAAKGWTVAFTSY
jgi:hypothetical protein